ncbi:class I SAM-dependent methyltransferase [Ekhidna sp.]|uniref:class I SAM-dependent methyltransferase n=1 Tax=Ekhidna sp. TaxID=2608089 RepID=UPI0032982C38
MIRLFLFRLRHYLKYRFRAVGLHSLHSPFLFELYNLVIKTSLDFRLENVEKLRKELKADHQIIDLYDLKEKKNYRKTIRSIAQTSLSKPKFSAFLYLLINHLKVTRVMETGTSLGINSLYMAGPERVKKVSTIEASPIIASIAKKQFSKLLQHKIEIKVGTVQEEFEALIVKEQPEICFIDADHRAEAVKLCVDHLINHCPHIKCIIVHDIYWSDDMFQGWNDLVKKNAFTLTIDLFQAGLIFPNMDMPKQHFTLRF